MVMDWNLAQYDKDLAIDELARRFNEGIQMRGSVSALDQSKWNTDAPHQKCAAGAREEAASNHHR